MNRVKKQGEAILPKNMIVTMFNLAIYIKLCMCLICHVQLQFVSSAPLPFSEKWMVFSIHGHSEDCSFLQDPGPN